MADNPIKLVNENGRIVGKDPDTGDTVPVEFETLQTEDGTIGPATSNGDIPLRLSQDGSNPFFSTVLAENDGWPDWKTLRTTGVFDGYDDHTFHIGHNIDSANSNQREDTTKPMMRDSWEASFDDGTYRKMERHIQGRFKDGTTYRLMGIKVRYADTDGNEEKNITVSWPDVDVFSIGDRVSGDEVFGLDILQNQLELGDDITLKMGNEAPLNQKDTGGTYREMVKLDQFDRQRIGTNAYDMNLNADNFIQVVPDKVSLGVGQLDDIQTGTNNNLGLKFDGGAGFYVNSSGEIVAVDEAGNETTLT